MRRKLLVLAFMLTPLGTVFAQGHLIDGIVAMVGTRQIFLSDIQMEMVRVKMQGTLAPRMDECDVLQSMLVHNLLLDQADLDSIPNAGDQGAEVERRLGYFIQQAGSEEELERRYGRPMREIRRDMLKILDEQQRTMQVRRSIVKDVMVTPSEVADFYQTQPLDSLPIVPEGFIFRQLVLNPQAEHDVDFEVRERLLSLRERILKGERFSTLAVAYSEDQGSSVRGGEMGYLPRESFVKPFADAAVSLQEGQVSNIVKTEYGYHILQLIGRKGKLMNVRHILLKPSFTSSMINRAIGRLDSISHLLGDSLSFEKACARFSDDKDTRLNGGYAVNPREGGLVFSKDVILPIDYYVLRELQPGQVSQPFESRDRNGNVIVKIIKLEEIIRPHRMSLEQDYDKVQDLAKARKEEEVFNHWLREKVASTYVSVDPRFDGCTFPFGKFRARAEGE